MSEKITISWSVEDVKGIAPDLSQEECGRVLDLADKWHDASIGINWEVLEEWAAVVRSERTDQ